MSIPISITIIAKNKPGVEIGTGEGNLNVPDDIITWAKIFV